MSPALPRVLAAGVSVRSLARSAIAAGYEVLTADGYAALWDKRGSLICLGSVEPSATYRYACIIQPVYLRLRRRRLRETHGLPLTAAHLDGRFRRFSGDFSETGRGEILAWSPA